MASTRTLDERISEAKTKLAQTENHLKQLLQKQKEAERKARTRRLIERGAILESMIDGAETLTNEEIQALLASALVPKGERGIQGQQPIPPANSVPPSGGA